VTRSQTLQKRDWWMGSIKEQKQQHN